MSVASMPKMSLRAVVVFFYDTLKLDNIEILTGVFRDETGGQSREP